MRHPGSGTACQMRSDEQTTTDSLSDCSRPGRILYATVQYADKQHTLFLINSTHPVFPVFKDSVLVFAHPSTCF
jgi:hypothetical protein